MSMKGITVERFSVLALVKYLQTKKGQIVVFATLAAILLAILVLAIILWPAPTPKSDADEEPDEDDMKSFKEMLEEQRKVAGDVMHGFTPKYEWTQTATDVELYFKPKDSSKLTGKDVKVDIKSDYLILTIGSEKVLEGELYANVVPGDSNWQFEGSGDTKRVWISLYKVEPTNKGNHWRAVLKGDEILLGTMGSNNTPILAVDGSNPTDIRRAVDVVTKKKQ